MPFLLSSHRSSQKQLVWKNPVCAIVIEAFALVCPKAFENLIWEGSYASHLSPKCITFLDSRSMSKFTTDFCTVCSWHLICARCQTLTWQCTDVHWLKHDKWNYALRAKLYTSWKEGSQNCWSPECLTSVLKAGVEGENILAGLKITLKICSGQCFQY